MDKYLIENIEALRQKMIEEFIEHDSLAHEHVIAISKKLDEYIVMYQQFKASTFTVKAII